MRLLALLLCAGISFGAAQGSAKLEQIQMDCSNQKNCILKFRFHRAQAKLPGFFKSYDAKFKVFTVGFTDVQSGLTESQKSFNKASPLIQSARMIQTKVKGKPSTVFQFKTGNLITSDAWRVHLSDSNEFQVLLPWDQRSSWQWVSEATPSVPVAATKTKPENTATSPNVAKAPVATTKTIELNHLEAYSSGLSEKLVLQFNKSLTMPSVSSKGAQATMTLFADAPSSLLRTFHLGSTALVKSAQISKMGDSLRVTIQLASTSATIRSFLLEDRLIFHVSGGKKALEQVSTWSSATEKWNPLGIRELNDAKKEPILRDLLPELKKAKSSQEVFSLKNGTNQFVVVAPRLPLLPDTNIDKNVGALVLGDRVQGRLLNSSWGYVRWQGQDYFARTHGLKLLSEADPGILKGIEDLRADSSFLRGVHSNSPAMIDRITAILSGSSKEAKSKNTGKELLPDSLMAQIDSVVLEQQEVVRYSSYGRRDPFIPLEAPTEKGINIDAVRLTGVIWEDNEPLVLLQDVRNANVTYTLREGEHILNGKVLKITQNEVLFLIREFGITRRYTMSLPREEQ